MKLTTVLKAALFIGASASVAHAAVYAGTVPTQASINTNSNLFLPGMPLSTAGTTTLQATVESGAISFGASDLQFQSSTFTGTQTILNPDTLNNTSVTYSITTNFSPITVPAIGSFSLNPATQGLSWMSMDPSVSPLSLTVSGSYSLSAGGQTVTGTFSYTNVLNLFYSTGNLTAPTAGEIALDGGNNAFIINNGGTSVPLINETVGGVPVYLNLSTGDAVKINGLLPTGNAVVLTAVPETSALALGVLGLAGCLRRRRVA